MSSLGLFLAASCAGGASVSILSPEDGARVESPFLVVAEADSFTIEAVGEVREDAGHLHVMVDTGCVAAGETIPEDGGHVHLGDGSEETELDLPAGEHTLCLQAGDGEHRALDLTDEITITVAGPDTMRAEDEQGDQAGAERWDGTYSGTVVWDCGAGGIQEGAIEATFTVEVDEEGTATMQAAHNVTGSCAGADVGTLTTPLTVTGQRTSEGFEFPSGLWGPPGSFTITVSGDRGRGTLSGPAPGPATITLEFETECRSC